MPESHPTSAIPLHLGPSETGTEANSPQLIADPVSYFTSGYRTHGPVFGTRYRGEDWVTIAGIDANDFFWQNTTDWSYARAGKGFRNQFGPTYVTQLDGAPHLRSRRLLKGGFSAEAVGRFVTTMSEEAARFLERRSDWGTDASVWLPGLLLSLNKSTLLMTEMTQEEMLEAIRLEGELIYGVGVSANPSAHFGRPGYAERKSRIFALVERELDARACGKRAPDNLQGLLEQDIGTLEPMSREELLNTGYMLLVAGIHNTAKLLVRTLERLSLDPGWTDELRSELGGYTPESFGRGLGAYPKLKATIFEAERLHPGATFLKRRPLRDLEFEGRIIKAGVGVLQAHTLPHFLPEYYPDPMAFAPRRWIQGDAPPRKALVDFGGGSHVCLGLNLTRIQLPIVLAAILTRYDLALGYTPAFQLRVDPGVEMTDHPEPISLTARSP